MYKKTGQRGRLSGKWKPHLVHVVHSRILGFWLLPRFFRFSVSLFLFCILFLLFLYYFIVAGTCGCGFVVAIVAL